MKPATTPRIHTCAHCEAPFEPKKAWSKFCTPACNSAWQNRRFTRGAILYDLWMCNRHERGIAKTLKVLHVMTRLAMYWYAQDRGKKTWNSAHSTVESVSWANATVVASGPLKRR